MAVLISSATGNLTASGTWKLVDSASYLNSESANTALTTSSVASSSFVPAAVAIDAVAVKLASRAASPSGTITVELYNVTTASVALTATIDVADLPVAAAADLQGGWIVFAFGSSVTPNGTDSYAVRAKTSASSQVNLFSSATTNWARALRTTTNQAPVAGDDMIVTGEHTGSGTGNSFTVTMNQTAATDYGSNSTSAVLPAIAVCKRGTLSYGISASTDYLLQLSGHLIVYGQGTFLVGASGAEVPRNGTATLQFDCAADGDFGLINRNESVCSLYGLSRSSGKDVSWCLLNADASANATSLSVDADTGWLDNDVIAVASTIKPGANQNEVGALNGDAGASSLTVDGFGGAGGGLANSHLGGSSSSSAQTVTLPDGTTTDCLMQAEVVNLTRNIKFKAVNSSFRTFIFNAPTSQFTSRWVEYTNIGVNTAGKRGIECDTKATGALDLRFNSIHDCAMGGFWLAPSTTDFCAAQIRDNVFYNFSSNSQGSAINIVTARTNRDGTYVVDRNVVIVGTGWGWRTADGSGTITNNRVIGTTTQYATSITAGTVTIQSGKFDGNVVHSCNTTSGLLISAQWIAAYLKGWRCWRNTVTQAEFNQANSIPSLIDLDDCHSWGTTYTWLTTGAVNLFWRNSVVASDSSFTTSAGPWFDGGVSNVLYENMYSSPSAALGGFLRPLLNDVTLGTSSPYNQVGLRMIGRNVMFGGSVNAGPSAPGILTPDSYISIERLDNTKGNHKTWMYSGTIARDAAIYNTAAPSARLTPSSSSSKLPSAPPLRGIKVPVADGVAGKQVSVYVRKSVVGDGAAYNGNQPRLIQRANPAIGQKNDVVLATASGAAGAWEQLTGTLSTPDDDGAFEIVVDCDGTAGWVNVDDFSST